MYSETAHCMFWLSTLAIALPTITLLLCLQGAAADSEAKSEELSMAVEELHKLLKDAGEGARHHKMVTVTIPTIYYFFLEEECEHPCFVCLGLCFKC